MTQLTVSCIQMNSVQGLAENLISAEGLIRQAKEEGAEMVLLPENIGCMARERKVKLSQASPETEHPAVIKFAALARELKLWIVAGSIAVTVPEIPDKMANRSLVFNPFGAIVGRYDKIHLYDATPKPGEIYRESGEITPGNKAVLVETPWGKLGLSVCYDVRFAHLYRALAKAGAVMLSVPAAFTQTTGKVHWHVLLRARAIETGCFVFAPAQTGTHDGGRRTYGHSLIVSPWGEILADGEEAVGVVTTTINLNKVAEARKAIPALKHDRSFDVE
ncbi:MAG: carbon-nitrogen hydrolase family protein [Alphaproteobacteria bacterium]|nr:carbon-nitrogen hydrolase family protein [Alphaproteobacteria bacterium]